MGLWDFLIGTKKSAKISTEIREALLAVNRPACLHCGHHTPRSTSTPTLMTSPCPPAIANERSVGLTFGPLHCSRLP